MIEAINCEAIRVGERLLDDAPAPNHIVEDKETVGFHLGQENLVVGVVAGFVGVDENEIEGMRWLPGEKFLFGVA